MLAACQHRTARGRKRAAGFSPAALMRLIAQAILNLLFMIGLALTLRLFFCLLVLLGVGSQNDFSVERKRLQQEIEAFAIFVGKSHSDV